MNKVCLLGLHCCPANHHGECVGDKEAMISMNICKEKLLKGGEQ